MIYLDNRSMSKRQNECAERVVKYVLTRSDEELGELTIEKIVYLLNIGRSQLYDTFKALKKITPGKFLMQAKMVRSAMLLEADKRISIKALSQKMGFSNSDYFNRIFKEYFGTTPGRYRHYTKSSRKQPHP